MDLERACGALNEGLAGLMEELAGLPPATGTLTARLSVSGATGRVDHVTWLTDTVVPVWAGARGDRGEDGTGTGDLRAEILGAARRHLSAIVFPATQQGGRPGIAGHLRGRSRFLGGLNGGLGVLESVVRYPRGGGSGVGGRT